MANNQAASKTAEDGHCDEAATRGKQSRGRPRLAAAMSDAERAQRYRDNKKLHAAPILSIKRDDHGVTFNRPTVIGHGATATSPSYGMLESRIILLNVGNMRLSDELQDARDQITALKKAFRAAGIVTRHEKSTADQSKGRR